MRFKNRYRTDSNRLPNWDYRDAGYYFVTICSQNRQPIFGQIEDGRVCLSPFGQIALDCWQAIPDHHKSVRIDEGIVMPNHMHGIIVILAQNVETGHGLSLPIRRFGEGQKGALGTIVGSFKSAVTRQINQLRDTPGATLWQPNYYDHIIRSERALSAIRQYIHDNPRRWHLDRYNPDATGQDPMAVDIWKLLQDPTVDDTP